MPSNCEDRVRKARVFSDVCLTAGRGKLVDWLPVVWGLAVENLSPRFRLSPEPARRYTRRKTPRFSAEGSAARLGHSS